MKSDEYGSDLSLPSSDKDLEPPGYTEPLGKVTVEKIVWRKRKNDFPLNSLSAEFLQKHFPGATTEDWNNWIWQLRNSFTTFEQLSTFLKLSENEIHSSFGKKKLPVRITPYYASLLDPSDPNQPLRKTMIPVLDELIIAPEEKSDPLSEESDSPVNHIVHRYPDRVLFLVTGFCAAYCRYCTRSHMVSKKDKCHANRSEWDTAIDYIRSHQEVRDVILSGGDPLTLSDFKLEYLLSKLRDIRHIEIIRIGTKVPVVLPHRITPSLVKILRKYHPLYMSIHFTHPNEITPETELACKWLADAGIPLGSQTVLLKGINDEVGIFKELAHKLLQVRVRPYYLYQCDPIPGSSHFRTPVSKGLEIIRGLRGHTSGYSIPHFVIDAPGGGGKIPLLPEYVTGRDEKGYLMVNYKGKTFLYPEQDS